MKMRSRRLSSTFFSVASTLPSSSVGLRNVLALLKSTATDVVPRNDRIRAVEKTMIPIRQAAASAAAVRIEVWRLRLARCSLRAMAASLLSRMVLKSLKHGEQCQT